MPDLTIPIDPRLAKLLRGEAASRVANAAEEVARLAQREADRLLGSPRDTAGDPLDESLDSARARLHRADALLGQLAATPESLTGPPEELEELARDAWRELTDDPFADMDRDKVDSPDKLRHMADVWELLDEIIAQARTAQGEPVEA